MDQFGNYINNAVKIGPVPRWKAENTCEGIKSLQLIRDCNESYLSSQNIDLGIILDNSAAAESNNTVFENIREFSQNISPTDNIMFSVFNNNYNELLPLMPAEQALPEFESMEMPPRKGLNSMNKAIYKSIQKLNAGASQKKALVVITYNSDNSSVIYNANDIMKASRESNVPVYIIAVGSSVNTFILRYITQSTGSRFYAVTEDELAEIPGILREIWFAQKSYYELKLNLPNEYRNSKSIKSTLSCEMGESKTLETLNINMKPLMPFSLFQTVCSFDYRSSDVPAEFDDNINSLAAYLKDNPAQNIELIGYSSIEGNVDYNSKVSFDRAEKVKNSLVKLGVSGSQVKTRAEGCSKPVYYLEQSAWQSSCNRRVEVRWLDSKALPYEIIAESLTNENEASSKADAWENLGYRAYYERYLVNNLPVYRIKIWGYGTYDEAVAAARELQKKYSHGFTIE
jgi:outer membrane protein OmpA-like peptidoglycan-associated protein